MKNKLFIFCVVLVANAQTQNFKVELINDILEEKLADMESAETLSDYMEAGLEYSKTVNRFKKIFLDQ